MIQLAHRSQLKELIDTPHIDATVLRQTYRQIKNINDATLGFWPIISALEYFLSKSKSRDISILDIGCGDGELLRRIEAYGLARNLCLSLRGIDLNPGIISIASQITRPTNIRFIQGDVLAHDQSGPYDLIITSLTMHHLTDVQIEKLLLWMTLNARLGWIISDLHRHPIAYYFIKYFVKLYRYNSLVCHDAPLSVARGFLRREWNDLLIQAAVDLDQVKIFWYPNFRYGIRYEKPI